MAGWEAPDLPDARMTRDLLVSNGVDTWCKSLGHRIPFAGNAHQPVAADARASRQTLAGDDEAVIARSVAGVLRVYEENISGMDHPGWERFIADNAHEYQAVAAGQMYFLRTFQRTLHGAGQGDTVAGQALGIALLASDALFVAACHAGDGRGGRELPIPPPGFMSALADASGATAWFASLGVQADERQRRVPPRCYSPDTAGSLAPVTGWR
jgi:hypothetical protein